MIDIRDCETGTSYACKYRDLTGEPALAVIRTRDLERELVLAIDVDTGMEMTLGFDAIWDVDVVEWQDEA